jgi:glycosyltransferase involved in cell wall biosynthesis
MNSERVSVVITTRNESRNIGACLASIAAQSYPPELVEIIVVDNASTDDTKAIASRYTPHVFDKGPERSAQRNHGFSRATGEIFMFLDADMILSSTVIERSVQLMGARNFCALYIPEIVLGKGFFPAVRRFERSFYDGTVIDCVRIFTREAFAATGGFDETLTGPEDWDFDRHMRDRCRVGVLCEYDFDRVNAYVQALPDPAPTAAPGAPVKPGGGSGRAGAPSLAREGAFDSAGNDPSGPRTGGVHSAGSDMVSRLTGYEYFSKDDRPLLFHNEAAFDLWRYLTKKTYYGGSFEAYIAKWPAGDPDIKRQFGLWYRFFGVFLEKGRWMRLATHPRLAFGMYFLRFLVGFMFVLDKLKR